MAARDPAVKLNPPAEKDVMAAIQVPDGHHGVFLPDRKKSFPLLPELRPTDAPDQTQITIQPTCVSTRRGRGCRLADACQFTATPLVADDGQKPLPWNRTCWSDATFGAKKEAGIWLH